MRLQGKVAVVTGGGSGFGAGICAKFVAEGAKVVVADLNLDGAKAVASALGAATLPLRADVSQAADVRAMLDAAERHFGALDILVNNAGVTHLPGPLEAVAEADFDRIVAVNMKAIYQAMREAVPRMKAKAPGAHGIRVVALNPVAGETPLLRSFMGEDTPEMRAKFLSTIPIGRFSTPEDLGNAACFLVSDEASMITGVCMEVDGGRCI